MLEKKLLFMLIMIFSLPISFLVSLIYGQIYIPLQEIFSPHGFYYTVLFKIRIPTVLAAALIGASLSIAGAIMQLLLRNPLMDPYVSGTASGGAFGAVMAYFLLAFNFPFNWIIYFSPLVAFIFSFIATIITLAIGKRTGVYGIIVGGVVVSYLFSSLLTVLLEAIEYKYPQVPPPLFWLLGEIQIVGYDYDEVLGFLVLTLVILAVIESRKLDLVHISDELSYAKKINPGKYRTAWIIFLSIIVGIIVSQVGIIGFIGIIVPHIVRRTVGGNSSTLIPFSALLGSSIMMLSNIIASGALGFVIPITAITSVLASPIIIYVLVKGRVSEGY
ncbi:iron ABC transporter permease [Acidianus sp. HS-5]|uniref:FecCD family ABC transporter permease n=1 Tax=Acidianus sp. HS-5 TaxID=2886040 RepID=UPI001F2DF35B|nr:iron ABC transporter permease [Acidianus sp. HS-5]BDC17929.1 iron ABC transporter [Acidianus sp. HS-5]